jgi:hypothetical protein
MEVSRLLTDASTAAECVVGDGCYSYVARVLTGTATRTRTDGTTHSLATGDVVSNPGPGYPGLIRGGVLITPAAGATVDVLENK